MAGVGGGTSRRHVSLGWGPAAAHRVGHAAIAGTARRQSAVPEGCHERTFCIKHASYSVWPSWVTLVPSQGGECGLCVAVHRYTGTPWYMSRQ